MIQYYCRFIYLFLFMDFRLALFADFSTSYRLFYEWTVPATWGGSVSSLSQAASISSWLYSSSLSTATIFVSTSLDILRYTQAHCLSSVSDTKRLFSVPDPNFQVIPDPGQNQTFTEHKIKKFLNHLEVFCIRLLYCFHQLFTWLNVYHQAI